MIEPAGMGLDRMIWALGFIGVPLALGAFIALLIGARWLDVLIAFAVLALLCGLAAFHGEQSWDKRFLAALIYWMVSCIPGIPIIVLVMRLVGLR